jgi:nucleotide-binding universal stress UspA family protein
MEGERETSMYKKVLVPLDGSRRAEAILKHVEELGRRYQAEVIFLQVIELAAPLLERGGDQTDAQRREAEQERRQAEEYLNELAEKFRNLGVHARSQVASGPVVDSIIKVANQEDADLIAMTSHGRSGLSQVIYGSVANGVLQRIDRPLLLVRSGAGSV